MSRLSALLLAATLAVPTFASAQATQPSTPAPRDYNIVNAEVKAAKAEFNEIFGKGPNAVASLRDPAVREKLKTTLPPIIRKLDTLEPEAALARAEWAKNSNVMMMGSPTFAIEAALRRLVLVAINDEAAVSAAKTAAAGSDPVAARNGAALLAGAEYLTAADEATQVAAVEKLTPLYASADGKDEQFDTTLLMLLMAKGANPTAEANLGKMLSTATPGKFVASMVRQRTGDAKQKSAQGKPATFVGTTIDGKAFDSSAWKGKVVLVDFWASWCGPCKAELPRVKELYAKYHNDGLEVLGISNDYTADALKNYLAANPLPWNSLFNAEAADAHKWHPITQSYGINGIPVMFLIDRKGILRSVTARSQLEKLIPELLSEKME